MCFSWSLPDTPHLYSATHAPKQRERRLGLRHHDSAGKTMTEDFTFDIDGLQQALGNTPPDVTSGLLEQMLESFKEQICIQECQFNRVVCILRPKCPQRHFQDLLLQSGYKHNNIPQFCYSVRLKEINEAHSRGHPFTPDITIYLDDFYRIFGQKKPRFQPKREFGKILSYFQLANVRKVNTGNGSDFHVIGLNKNVLFVNIGRELVTLNPNNWVLKDLNLIKATIQVLAGEYDVRADFQEESVSFLVITFSFPDQEGKANPEQLEDLIRQSDPLIGFDVDAGEVYAEVQIPQKGRSFTIRHLRRLFEDLGGITFEKPKEQEVEESATEPGKA